MRTVINSANGVLTSGGKVLYKLDDTLPSGYTSVSYVSLSRMLLDTGHQTKDTSVIEAKVRVASTTQTYLWNSDANTSGSTNTTAYSSSAGNWRFGNTYVSIANTTFVGAMHTFKQSREGVWRDGTKVASYPTVPSFTSTANLQFGSSVAVSVGFEYFKHTVDGELVSWYVSCKRNSDNVAGFYDLVNDVFLEGGTATT